MGRDDTAVDRKSRGRTATTVTVQDPAKQAGAPVPTGSTLAKPKQHCGAMSQQRGDSGSLSTPQKFVRLIGCRDRKARS